MPRTKFKLKGTAETVNQTENLSNLAIKSVSSESVEFNNIKVPELQTEGVYNFYTAGERDAGIFENPRKRAKFLKNRGISGNPRVIKLKWDRCFVGQGFRRPEVSIDRNPTRMTIDGFHSFITDLQGLNIAFASLVNDNLFPNTISTYVAAKQTDLISRGARTGSVSILNTKKTMARMSIHNRALVQLAPRMNSLHRKTPSKRAIVELGGYLKNIKMLKTPPEHFRSLPELAGLDYVGYVIEKERFIGGKGWKPIGVYRIFGKKMRSFKDSLVAYGKKYRYRVRCIVRLTVLEDHVDGDSFRSVENLNVDEFRELQEDIESKSKFINAVIRASNRGISYKRSTGPVSRKIALGADRVLTVNQGFFNLDQVEAPTDIQLNTIRLLNNSIVDLELIKPPPIDNEVEGGKRPGSLDPKEVETPEIEKVYNSYYFSGEASEWSYVSVIDRTPPPYPQYILITPSTPKKEIMLTWLNPSGPQRDVIYHNIYYKSAIGDSWKKLARLNKKQNIFIHTNLEVGRNYIYALTCTDRHGLESYLSMQIQATLNPDFEKEQQEKKLVWVSGGGGKPFERGVIYKKFVDNVDPDVIKKKFTISPKLDFKGNTRNLMIRVTSLDTHEQKEFNVTVKNELKPKPSAQLKSQTDAPGVQEETFEVPRGTGDEPKESIAFEEGKTSRGSRYPR